MQLDLDERLLLALRSVVIGISLMLLELQKRIQNTGQLLMKYATNLSEEGFILQKTIQDGLYIGYTGNWESKTLIRISFSLVQQLMTYLEICIEICTLNTFNG